MSKVGWFTNDSRFVGKKVIFLSANLYRMVKIFINLALIIVYNEEEFNDDVDVYKISEYSELKKVSAVIVDNNISLIFNNK